MPEGDKRKIIIIGSNEISSTTNILINAVREGKDIHVVIVDEPDTTTQFVLTKYPEIIKPVESFKEKRPSKNWERRPY